MALNKKSNSPIGGFFRNERGNVTLIFGFAVIPLVLAGGVAIDYARDAMVRGRLAAIADAAALAATTPAMMSQTSTTAQAAATSMFAAQAAMISGLTYNSTKLTVTVTDSTAANGNARSASVVYAGTVNNIFGALENKTQTAFTVSSTATISSAPNINFYLMLDSSTSMLLPATAAGISSHGQQGGCALACHEADFTDSENTVQYAGWGKMDSYTYAENNGDHPAHRQCANSGAEPRHDGPEHHGDLQRDCVGEPTRSPIRWPPIHLATT